jgi:hypothetical protein
MDTHELAGEKLIVGYRPLAEFLTDNGFPLSTSTVSKYCSPAIDIGPPVEAYWGRLPAFSPSHALAWARARLKPVSAVRSKPVVTSDAGRPDDRSPSAGLPARGLSPPTPESGCLTLEAPEHPSPRPGVSRELPPPVVTPARAKPERKKWPGRRRPRLKTQEDEPGEAE